MEQIKKYNYKDPLHQKGDPFGATEAKVAHVNDVITEVNNIDTRVTTLENAPAPQGSTEYYINGGILHFADGTFAVTVDSHNTPVRSQYNGNYDVYGQNANVFGFFGDTNGNFTLGFQNTQGIVADLNDGNGSQSCNITTAVPSLIVITPQSNLIDAYANASKAFITATVQTYVQSTDLDSIADIVTYLYDPQGTKTMKGNIPLPSGMRRIFEFQLRFSEFIVEAA